MKKAGKPAGKKSAQTKMAAKKPSAEKVPAKPSRKAEEQSHLALVVTRLELVASTLTQIAERLDEIAEHLARLIPPAASAAAATPMHEPIDEHADDVEVRETRKE